MYEEGQDTSKNGEILNAIDGEIQVVLGAENELEATFLNEESVNIANDKLLKIDTPTGKELYRIYNVVKSFNSTKVYARAKYFDLKDKVILSNVEGTRQQILDTILSRTGYTGKYIGSKTDIITVEGKTNVIEILSSLEEEYTVQGNVITLGTVGTDKGYTVEFGYNLQEIEENLSVDDVITRIYPCYQDIIGDPVDSVYINNYSLPHESFIDFEITSENEDEEYTEQQIKDILKQKAKDYFNTTNCDKPICNYTVKMIDLSKTTEYKNYKILESIGLGDTVTCKNKKLNINCKERCISYEWDFINKAYENIELGQHKETYNDRIIKNEKNTIKIIDDTKKKLSEDIDDAKEEAATATNNLKVTMEERANGIELSVKNEKEDRETAIELLDGKIQSKVSQGQLGTLIEQNYEHVLTAIEDGSGTYVLIDRNGLTVNNGKLIIKDTNDVKVVYMSNKGLTIEDIYLGSTAREKGSNFYNSLLNMDEIPLDNGYVGNLSLEDYIIEIIRQNT
ncbi:phage tail spike protein [Clostridium neonatale]|uniref:phage tail spike protein n=1 Tax=Clostridium neonatale TaxID=137838 RepID=UPI001E28A536|nr:phage tail spike protein [Clostridium neonatale]